VAVARIGLGRRPLFLELTLGKQWISVPSVFPKQVSPGLSLETPETKAVIRVKNGNSIPRKQLFRSATLPRFHPLESTKTLYLELMIGTF
jgi:hypothetical protein